METNLMLRVENHQGDINNVLQINRDQLEQVSQNPKFSSLIESFEGLISELGYQFDLNVNMLGNKDIYLVLNALAYALLGANELHNFVWNSEGYNIGRLLEILAVTEDIDAVIDRMHEYITNRDVLGADQAWDPEQERNNKRHIARILWHVRNTICVYDATEHTKNLGIATEREVIENDLDIQRDIKFIEEKILDPERFNLIGSEAFRNEDTGLKLILNTINNIFQRGMSLLERIYPGDENLIRRLQILDGLLNTFAEKFNDKLEDLFIDLITEGNFKVDLGIQGVGKGTIADSIEYMATLLSSTEDSIRISKSHGGIDVYGIDIFKKLYSNLGEEITGVLGEQFDFGLESNSGSDTYRVNLATGTGAIFNPKDPEKQDKKTMYDVYFGRVGFAGQYVPKGLMVGDKITHFVVMIENLLAALDARARGAKKLEIKWDVYPRTAGQVELMMRFINKINKKKKGTLVMSNFFGMDIETLDKHKDKEGKLTKESKSAALAWGVTETNIKTHDSEINKALRDNGVYQNVYLIIENEIEGFDDIVNELKRLGDSSIAKPTKVNDAKFTYLSDPKIRDNHEFWEAVEKAVQANNDRMHEFFSDNGEIRTGILPLIQNALEKEISLAKYAGRQAEFILDAKSLSPLINDYLNQTMRSMDLIAGRIRKIFRADDAELFAIAGRMASNDKDSLPNLADNLDEHYAVGYPGGDALVKYIEQVIRRKLPNFNSEEGNWRAFAKLLGELHEIINLSKQEKFTFAGES